MPYVLRASKRILLMRLERQARPYPLNNSSQTRNVLILNHLLRCDGTRPKAISRYCPSKKLFFPTQGAKITKASHFDYEYVLGHKIVFLCVAKGKPHPQIIWYKDGRELYGHRYLHVSIFKRKRKSSGDCPFLFFQRDCLT